MADVLGEAVVEVIPDVKNFGKNLNKQLSGVTDDVSKSVKGIDREFASLSGSIDDSFSDVASSVDKSFAEMAAHVEKNGSLAVNSQKKASKEVEAAWKDANAQIAKAIFDAQDKNEKSADKTAAAWRTTTASMKKEFIEVGLEAGKSATQIQKEFERGSKATEKALSNLAKNSAKQIESDMKRAAKATEKALKDSAKLAEKEYNDIAKAAKKAADEQENAAKKAANSSRDSDSSLSKLGSKISSITGLFFKMGSAGASIGSIIPIAAALVSALQAASGAALILPGALVSIGLAGATLKLAFSGIGEALSADNAKELEKAMANLPPVAQEFVKALRNVKDEFEGVRRGVQSAFFSGLDAKIDQLGSALLPIVTRGLVGIAQELNITAKSFADMLLESENVKTVDAIFDATRITVHNLGEALAPIGQALLDIAQVGAEAFADLTDGVGTAAQKFADFIREMKESGKLRDIIDGGIEAFKILGGLLADIGAIVKNVFGPLIEGAGQLGTPLNAVLNVFREFTAQQQFVDLMQNIGKIMGELAQVVGTVLSAALKAVLPFIEKLVSLLVDHLQTVIPIITPLFEKLAGFLGDLLVALLPLIEPFFTLVQKLLPPMVDLLTRIINVIDIGKITQLATVIGDSLSKAVTDLVPHIVEFADKLANLFEKMGPTIDTFLDFAINVLPIVITGIGVLGGALIDFISFFLDPLALAWEAIGFLVTEIWQGIKDWIILKVAEIIKGLDIISELPDKIGGWFGEMRQAASDKLSELVDFVAGIPGKIRDSLGDLGRILWDAGARVISGFIDGIKSKVSEIGSVLGGITSSIPIWKGPPVVDEKLLTPNGQLIMDGLVAGFKKGEKGVKVHLDGLTQSIADQMNDGAGNAARSVNSMTSKLSPGGAITQAAITEAAATRAAITLSRETGDQNVDVTVVMGDEVLDSMVTDIIVTRDKRTKRAVTAGGRRTP